VLVSVWSVHNELAFSAHIWNPQFGFRPHLIFGHLREIVTVIESRTTRGKGLSRIGASNRCSALARAVAGGAMPPTSGAQSGRLGGIASAAARNSRALHAAPRVTPVRVVERSQGKRQKIAAATEDGVSCATSVAMALATTAKVTPEVAALMTAAAQAAVAAVQSQPAACKVASSSKRQRHPQQAPRLAASGRRRLRPLRAACPTRETSLHLQLLRPRQ
jgi:hypothetical protein